MGQHTLVVILGVFGLLSIGAWSVLKQRCPSNRSASSGRRQPIPELTPDDLERIVRRDFSAGTHQEVIAILNEYASPRESAATRVQAAARRDYRDVLVAAEYPEYWKATSGARDLPRREHQRVIDADWKQYENWLRK